MSYTQFRGSKYGARKTVTGGRQYDSKKEAGYAQRLELLKKAKEIREWRPQVTLQLFAYGKKIARYRTDFEVITKDGSIEFHETKGFRTEGFNLKWALLEACKDTEDFRLYNGYTMNADLKMVLIT